MLELIFSRPGADGQIDIGWMQQLAYADLSKKLAVLGSGSDRRTFKRETTPLVDLLPAMWRKYIAGNANVSDPSDGRRR